MVYINYLKIFILNEYNNMICVGINGFGSIGCLVFKIIEKKDRMDYQLLLMTHLLHLNMQFIYLNMIVFMTPLMPIYLLIK